MARKHVLRLAGALAAAVIAAASSGMGIAAAGPDDGVAHVATGGHVDSPKAFWEDNNFVLRTGQGEAHPRLEDSVLWYSKGNGDKQQFVYEVGHHADEDFLGPPGTLLYQGPIYADDRPPIWVGYGADGAIPTDQFRDGAFTMNMVNFDGPGRYELFTALDDSTSRAHSSHEPGLRSVWAVAGTHVHETSTFTKPGRYEVTYQATARDHSGALIASEPQTAVWQIGGTKPSSDGIGDVATAYNASAHESLPPAPRFTIAPHDQARVHERLGAEYLTDLIFTTGDDADNGTAVFYIDGYFLAEVDVIHGQAVWPEMIGSTESQFQVVYVPGSAGMRWISQPLTSTTGAAEVSTAALGTFPQRAPQDPPPPFTSDEIEPTSTDVTVRAEHVDGSALTKVTVEPADPRVTMRVEGGLVRPGDSTWYCALEFTSAPQRRSALINNDGCTDAGTTLQFTAVPSPLVTAGAARVSMPAVGSATATLGAGTDAPGPDGPGGPGGPGGPDGDGMDGDGGGVEIATGHVDFGPVAQPDGSYAMSATRDSTIEAGKKVYSALSDTTLVVSANTRRTLPDDPTFSFIGAPGDEVYSLPLTQDKRFVWPGFSTEHGDGHNFAIELRPESEPLVGSWYAFLPGPFGKPTVLGSSSGATSPPQLAGTDKHVHTEWVFTAPGEYEIAMRAVSVDDPALTTPWSTVTFRVGEDGGGDGGGDGGTAPPTRPRPSPTPDPDTPPTRPSPAKPDPANPGPANPGPANPGGAPDAQSVRITQGHIDIGPVASGGAVRLLVGDDSRQYSTDKVYRDPAAVTLVASDDFAHTLTAADVSGDLAFLGAAGQQVHLLPQVQRGSELWPGFSTEHAGGGAWDIEITPESAPADGRWFAYTSGTFGGMDELIASSDGGGALIRESPVHLHNNWAFTRPGVYTMRMRAAQHGNPGNATDWATITFEVGNGNGAAAGGEPPAPGAPGAAPPKKAPPTSGAPRANAQGPGSRGGGRTGGAAAAPGSGGSAHGSADTAAASGRGGARGGAPGAASGAVRPAGAVPVSAGGRGAHTGPELATLAESADGASGASRWRTAGTVAGVVMTICGLGLGAVGTWRRYIEPLG